MFDKLKQQVHIELEITMNKIEDGVSHRKSSSSAPLDG